MREQYIRPITTVLIGIVLMCVPAHHLFGFAVIDALGRQVTFEEPPDRVVVAGRGLLMVVDAMYLFPETSSRLIALERITQGRGNFIEIIDSLTQAGCSDPQELSRPKAWHTS
jgi:hypothetical protein